MGDFQASEKAILNILRKAGDRVRDNIVKSIERIENSIADHQYVCREWKSCNNNISNELQAECDNKTNLVAEQLQQDLERQQNSLKSWSKIIDLLNPVFKTFSITEIRKLIDYELSVEFHRGLRLMQSDFKKKRENKPDIREPGYIERILNDYDKYRLNAEEYRDISYWLTIAETDKWLERFAGEPESHCNPHGLSFDFDDYDRRKEEAFEKYRLQVFKSLGSTTKELINSPETTWPRGSEQFKAFIRKHNRKMTEHLINDLAWWFFVQKGYDAHEMPCKGMGTPEEIVEFQINFKEYFRGSVIKYFATISIEEALKQSVDRPAEQAIEGLEDMLNTFKKRELRESHFGFQDDNADWRAYNIKLITQEIDFQKKRLAVKLVGVPDKSSTYSPENESTIRTGTNTLSQKDLSAEKEVYRIVSEHKPGETWPDCVFDELFEIQKRTGETNLKVCERFCEIAGITEQARALKKAWIDHNSERKKKNTIQAQSGNETGTI
jgi:hypothetical protein